MLCGVNVLRCFYESARKCCLKLHVSQMLQSLHIYRERDVCCWQECENYTYTHFSMSILVAFCKNHKVTIKKLIAARYVSSASQR